MYIYNVLVAKLLFLFESDKKIYYFSVFLPFLSSFCCTFAPRMNEKKQKNSNTTYDHVLKYTGIFGGVQVLKILVNVCRNKLASVILGPVGLGLNAINLSISELVNSFSNFGLSFSSVRNISELFEKGDNEATSRYVRVIRTWSFLAALLGALLCCTLPIWLPAAFSLISWISFELFGVVPDNEIVTHVQQHGLDAVLLSLMVFSLPIEASECSILKGIRQLKCLSLIEVLAALATLVCTIPFYYMLGYRGIVLALILSSWSVALIHLYFSTKFYKWRISPFNKDVLREGIGLIRLGVPYMLSGIVGAISAFVVLGFLGSAGEIGLYKAGYGLMVTYAGMVFVAVEADYFPRLSAANADYQRSNVIINQQIDVCVLLMTPLLILLSLFMPRIIHLLYAHDFIAIAPMAVCAVYYMFFKAITLPVAYLPLAKGRSMMYLCMELLYDIVYAALIYWGYRFGSDYLDFTFDDIPCGGLVGTGLALSAAGLFDLLLICGTYSATYKFRFEGRTIGLIIFEFICLTSTVPFCLVGGMKWFKYGFGFLALAISCILAWRFLSTYSHFGSRILNKFRHHHDCDCCK